MRKLSYTGATLILIFLSLSVFGGGEYISIADGDWSNPAIWSKVSGGGSAPPGSGDVITIDGHAINLDMDVYEQPGINSLTINGGGSIIDTGTPDSLYIANSGIVNINDGSVSIKSIVFKASGTITISLSSTLTVTNILTNEADMVLDGTVTVGTEFINTGTVTGGGTISAATYSGGGLIFGVASTSSLNGTTIGGWTWEGTAGTADWNTVSNWTSGEITTTVPTSASNVSILDGTIDPVISGSYSAKFITINSGAVLAIAPGADLTVVDSITNNAGYSGLVIQSDATGDGSLICNSTTPPSATIQRHVTASEWNMVSPSTTGTTGQTFSDASVNDSWLLWFDETTGIHGGTAGTGWNYITDLSTSVDVGSGYNYWPSVDETVSFVGSIQRTDFPATVTWKDADHGYNLIGNPFSSAVQWNDHNSWNISNMEATIWIYDGSQYNSYTTTATHDIALGQGVFVRAIAASPTLSFPVSQRVHSTDTYQKNSTSVNGYYNSLVITAQNDQKSDRIQISFGENGTTGFDNGWDATKMFGEVIAPQLFMLEENIELSYNHLPLIEEGAGKTVIMNYGVGADGEQTLITDLHNYSGGEIILEDLHTNTLHNLTENPVYTFEASIDDDENRFLLHFSYTTVDIADENMDSKISIYSFEKDVYIRSVEKTKNTLPGEVLIYDLYGRTIIHQKLDNSTLTKIPVNISNNYVIVKVLNETTVKVEKVFIK